MTYNKFSKFQLLMFIMSAIAVSGALIGIFGNLNGLMGSLGWLLSLFWMWITCGMKGYIRAFEERNKLILDLVEEFKSKKEEQTNMGQNG